MARANWLADKLREYGCNVVEVDDWKTRGNATFDPKGVVAHHTAGSPSGDAPSLRVCINGHGSLPGPLANVVLSRSGICYVIASGRANHAGRGGFRGLSGNSSVFGIEAENTGVGEPWSAQQLDAYYKCTAAMLDGIGRDASWVCGHHEWATPPGRKIDPRGFTMDSFRTEVGKALGKTAPAPSPTPKPKPTPKPAPRPASNVLKRGDRGPAVVNLQNTLNFWGHNAGKADGIFGAQTEAAVKRYQKGLKVSVDGIWGPQSQKAHDDLMKYFQSLNAKKAKPVARPWLRQGDRGEHVKYLQQRLTAHGFSTKADGIYGPQTLRSVLRFQTAKAIGADGIVGPLTWGRLG
jgi:peptidoglycan hydrolase-like protein with peptidoglycan-binding domain